MKVEMEIKFKLGDKVRDTITGFEGIVGARTDWLSGCVKYAVQSRTLKDGKPLDLEWFDEQVLEVMLEEGVKDDSKPRGGPRTSPSRSHPTPRE